MLVGKEGGQHSWPPPRGACLVWTLTELALGFLHNLPSRSQVIHVRQNVPSRGGSQFHTLPNHLQESKRGRGGTASGFAPQLEPVEGETGLLH